MSTNGKPKPEVQVLAVLEACFKVGVKVKADSEWVFNALRFAVWGDADAYARDLLHRWVAIVEVCVQESDDHPNATFPVPSDRYLVNRNG